MPRSKKLTLYSLMRIIEEINPQLKMFLTANRAFTQFCKNYLKVYSANPLFCNTKDHETLLRIYRTNELFNLQIKCKCRPCTITGSLTSGTYPYIIVSEYYVKLIEKWWLYLLSHENDKRRV